MRIFLGALNNLPRVQTLLHPWLFGPAFSGPAFSTPNIWSSIFWSCIFSPPIFFCKSHDRSFSFASSRNFIIIAVLRELAKDDCSLRHDGESSSSALLSAYAEMLKQTLAILQPTPWADVLWLDEIQTPPSIVPLLRWKPNDCAHRTMPVYKTFLI